MKVKTTEGAVVDVGIEEVLRAAGVIYQARRKTHGHPPLHAYRCRWCSGEVRGRGPLEAHERDCNQRPTGDLAGFTAEDLAALSWPPPDV